MDDNYSKLVSRLNQEGVQLLVTNPIILIEDVRRYRVQYIPFEYVNPAAKLVVVGITPGNTQVAGTYETLRRMAASGEPKVSVLRAIKRENSFGGKSMQPNLLKMLRHFEFEKLLGIEDVAELWGKSHHLFQATSVVPNAAFKWAKKKGVEGWQPFAGSFADVQRVPMLRNEFESVFLKSVQTMNSGALYLGLGPTPHEALQYCVDKSLIRPEQFLGSFPHPSSSGGSQVDYFLRVKPRVEIKPTNPTFHILDRLDAAYNRMSAASLAWR